MDIQHEPTKAAAHSRATKILAERRAQKLKVAASRPPAPDDIAPASLEATPNPPPLPSSGGRVGLAAAESTARKAREVLADLVTRLDAARLDGTTSIKERGKL